MKLLRSLLVPASLILASTVNAAFIETDTGVSVVNDNGDGTYTFIFDQGFTIDRLNTNGNGLSFSGSGLNLIVTGSGNVIQDWPSNGGLGVDGGAAGDNLAGSEWLKFDFDVPFDLLNITFNGLKAGDGHQDEADGIVSLTGSAGTGIGVNTGIFDGVGVDFSDISTLCGSWPAYYCGLDYFTVSPTSSFEGYVESITIGNVAVPEPSIIALFGLGLVGIGFARRRQS